MTHTIIAVEGAHDSSFFGFLLKRRGYTEVRALSQLPAFWKELVPTRFPAEGEFLSRVMNFPSVYVHPNGNAVGLIVADGETKLIGALRTALERVGVDQFSGVGVAVDADRQLPIADRWRAITARLETLNREALQEGVPGFPLAVPAASGAVAAGPPRMGIYLFPDNASPGILETLLLSCAASDLPAIHAASSDMVDGLLRDHSGDEKLAKLRAVSGREKSVAGAIANILAPGASLAVALGSGQWLGAISATHPAIQSADQFLGALI